VPRDFSRFTNHFSPGERASAPGVTRTPDRRIRNPLLYPAELRAPNECKVAVRLLMAIFFAAALVPHDSAAAEGDKAKSMNSLFVIVPYKHYGSWVFDDPAVGLNREPFVAGIDTLIDKATAKIPGAERGFRAVFSATFFPGADFKLEWRRGEGGGNWYYSPEFKQEGWLCPALFKYFKTAPPEIYVKVEPLQR
jgi:hypothetical protein